MRRLRSQRFSSKSKVEEIEIVWDLPAYQLSQSGPIVVKPGFADKLVNP